MITQTSPNAIFPARQPPNGPRERPKYSIRIVNHLASLRAGKRDDAINAKSALTSAQLTKTIQVERQSARINPYRLNDAVAHHAIGIAVMHQKPYPKSRMNLSSLNKETRRYRSDNQQTGYSDEGHAALFQRTFLDQIGERLACAARFEHIGRNHTARRFRTVANRTHGILVRGYLNQALADRLAERLADRLLVGAQLEREHVTRGQRLRIVAQIEQRQRKLFLDTAHREAESGAAGHGKECPTIAEPIRLAGHIPVANDPLTIAGHRLRRAQQRNRDHEFFHAQSSQPKPGILP